MYNVARAAEILDLHPKTVRRFIREGKIKATRIGREWRISKAALQEYAHAELAHPPDAPQSATPLGSRIQVSAVIELSEGHSEEVSRISNSLLAMLDSKDPEWGASRCDLLYHPETRKARFVLNGTPRFIRTLMELVEVLTQERGAAEREEVP